MVKSADMHSIAIGSLLVAVALVGFLTVADDLRHSGEFFVVSGILLSGLAFLTWALLPRLRRYLDLRWLGAGVAPGLLLGTVLDRAALGLGVGLVLGLAVSTLCRRDVSAGGGQGT
jgi:hypothetical protein